MLNYPSHTKANTLYSMFPPWFKKNRALLQEQKHTATFNHLPKLHTEICLQANFSQQVIHWRQSFPLCLPLYTDSSQLTSNHVYYHQSPTRAPKLNSQKRAWLAHKLDNETIWKTFAESFPFSKNVCEDPNQTGGWTHYELKKVRLWFVLMYVANLHFGHLFIWKSSNKSKSV